MRGALFLLSLYALTAPSPLAAGVDFPVCMYGITGPEELPVIERAGFNCFQTYVREPARLAGLAAGAAKLGLRMVAPPDEVIGSAYGKRAGNWPMLAWYLYDEPEVRRLPPEELRRLDRRVKEWNRGGRTAFVMGEGVAAYTYGAAADVLMVDWYPVPHLPLESVGQQIALAREISGKPVWAVLQAFDWAGYPQRRVRKVGGFPTFTQLRFMTYLALARGAAGIFYFQYSTAGDGRLPDNPARWAMLTKMADELGRLGPLIAGGEPAEPPAGLAPDLAAFSFRAKGRKYLVLLNPSPAGIPLNAGALKEWRPLFEEKRGVDELLPGGSEKYFPPYRVLVLEN